MTKHKHAELMAQYAQDAMETDKPWERWEYKPPTGDWESIIAPPVWRESGEYRRKPETKPQTEYVYRHRLNVVEEGAVNEARDLQDATHISVYRRIKGQCVDQEEWIYDIEVPYELRQVLRNLQQAADYLYLMQGKHMSGFKGESE